MDTKFNGKIWTFGDDIDTDTIIPGKRGTIPTIEEMKRYAFELLKPEFGTAVKPGDILVAGKNFGCGSSREQAATVLSHNGVRCIIAKSFARIFFRNAFNNGIILLQCDGIQEVVKGGDIVTVDLENKTVSANGKSFPVGAIPQNLLEIVEHGGLVEDTKAKIKAGYKAPELPVMSDASLRRKGFTLAEKILRKNAGVEEVKPGDIVVTHPDFLMIHDIYTPYLLDTLHEMGTKEIDDPDKVCIVFDHCMPTAVAKNDSAHYDAGLKLAEEYGIKKLHIGEGICHSLMHEKFYAKPGEVQSATDSHTTTYGGAGCFCSGIGTAEMAAALTTGELWFKVPSAIKVVLNGHFPKGVFSKDIILRILGDITASGAQYKSLEFTGPAAREMSLDARFTVANMALENAVRAYKALGEKNPKIAVLSAMEGVNSKLEQTVEAAEIKKEGIKGAIVEGPISLDLAMDKEACAIKGYESPVAGDADILLVPDIVAGNLAAKSMTVLGGCKTGGVVVGGLVPVILVSRAATVTDKYLAIVMAAMTSKKR